MHLARYFCPLFGCTATASACVPFGHCHTKYDQVYLPIVCFIYVFVSLFVMWFRSSIRSLFAFDHSIQYASLIYLFNLDPFQSFACIAYVTHVKHKLSIAMLLSNGLPSLKYKPLWTQSQWMAFSRSFSLSLFSLPHASNALYWSEYIFIRSGAWCSTISVPFQSYRF